MGRSRPLTTLLPLPPFLASLPFLAFLLFLAACGAADPPPPNVLLISLDTLRVDRLGCYGSAAGLTPELDTLAAGATRWERCTATAPWTVPSHASMFTGLYPHAHGAHSFEPVSARVDNVWTLAEEHETLAEVLAAEGYATGAVVANVAYLGPALGLSQGFEDWSLSRERAPRINKEALQWIDRVPEGRPWML
ncbi:MAG: sulfatase-like hydrolase/transferase, partial [Planctomycetota bacterium]